MEKSNSSLVDKFLAFVKQAEFEMDTLSHPQLTSIKLGEREYSYIDIHRILYKILENLQADKPLFCDITILLNNDVIDKQTEINILSLFAVPDSRTYINEAYSPEDFKTMIANIANDFPILTGTVPEIQRETAINEFQKLVFSERETATSILNGWVVANSDRISRAIANLYNEDTSDIIYEIFGVGAVTKAKIIYNIVLNSRDKEYALTKL